MMLNPEVEAAVKSNTPSPNFLAGSALNVIVWFALFITSACGTSVAGLVPASPDWLAVIIVVPAFKIVTVFPLMAAMVGSELE